MARRTAQLGEVRSRARTARVDVTLRAARTAATVPPRSGDGHLTPGEALGTAGRLLGAAGAIALLVALLAGPPALLAAGGALAARRLRGRRREAALRAT